MTRSLASAGLEKETLLIVASDNGAVPYISNAESSSGSNWPLRGLKVRGGRAGYELSGGGDDTRASITGVQLGGRKQGSRVHSLRGQDLGHCRGLDVLGPLPRDRLAAHHHRRLPRPSRPRAGRRRRVQPGALGRSARAAWRQFAER